MNFNKTDLIGQLVKKHNYTKKAATTLVDDFLDIILENLRQGNTVSLYGFGCFDILKRSARKCPDPQTGVLIDIPPHHVPRFYPGSRMRRFVKMWEDDVKKGLI